MPDVLDIGPNALRTGISYIKVKIIIAIEFQQESGIRSYFVNLVI